MGIVGEIRPAFRRLRMIDFACVSGREPADRVIAARNKQRAVGMYTVERQFIPLNIAVILGH